MCLKLSLMEGQLDMHIINQCLKLSLYHLWKVNLTCIIINQCFKSLYHSWKVNMYIISETVQYIIIYYKFISTLGARATQDQRDRSSARA